MQPQLGPIACSQLRLFAIAEFFLKALMLFPHYNTTGKNKNKFSTDFYLPKITPTNLNWPAINFSKSLHFYIISPYIINRYMYLLQNKIFICLGMVNVAKIIIAGH